MKIIKKSNELLWVFGIIFVALGVAICSKADLGVSMIAAPAFIVSEALLPLFSFFSVGVTEYILQAIILVILCIVIRKFSWKFLLAFAVAVIYGYILNLFLFLLGNINLNAVWQRWIALIIGDIITAFGVACFFQTYMPLQVHELFVSEFSKCFNISITKTKWCFDITLLIISVLLTLILFDDFKTFDWSGIYFTSFHSIGLGTVLTTVINSPVISFWSKVINKIFDTSALFPKLKNII